MKILRILLLASITVQVSSARAGEPELPRPFVKKSFLIIKSTPHFDEAKLFAEKAATALGVKLDLRGLERNNEAGLSLSPKGCEENGFEFPCYVSRGRYDDGSYVSLEHSSAFEGFVKGLYIVIAASGASQSAEMKEALRHAKEKYPDAYIKTTQVYTGCLH